MTMSASYFDLLKYAATGIASPDMTYYDKMRASTLMGGVVRTLTGIPPLTFKADGTPLISWSMKGNGEQTGTPSPQSIIMPTFCGVRTGNLFDKNATNTANGYIKDTMLQSDGTTISWNVFSVSEYIPITGGETYYISNVMNAAFNAPSMCFYDSSKQFVSSVVYQSRYSFGFTAPATAAFVRISYMNVTIDSVMLNLGSTALPYEPFGWAEKITCAGQTVPVYLGQTQTVRRIKKLVLTGSNGNFTKNDADPTHYLYHTSVSTFPNSVAKTPLLCNELPVTNSAPQFQIGISSTSNFNVVYFNFGADIMNAQPHGNTATGLKEYLTAQYAAGHPVTVWYVLATPETGITNEPLCKIGTYADELNSEDAGVSIPTAKGNNVLTIDTPIQPSEMTITFKG